MKKIQDSNIGYRLFFAYTKFAFSNFFRQTEVRGLENIPSSEPVIFAPNHQSGLMDPLVVLLNRNEQIVFMARADIFKNKIVAVILRFLKIMPVFRIRDGFENLGKNETQFDLAKDVLLDNKKLCLMPEGNHGHQHKLRPLVKGIFRIAFSAEETLAGKSHVRIVPTGIDHSHFRHAGSDIVLTFGKPIHIEDFIAIYQENPANGLNALREKLAGDLTKLMHDIRSESNYDLIYSLCCLGAPAYLEAQAEKGNKDERIPFTAATHAGLFYNARKALGLLLDKLDGDSSPLLTEWENLCANLNCLPGYMDEKTTWMEYKPNVLNTILLILMSLFFLPGLLLNTPGWLINRTFCKGIKDEQMHNTFAFVCGFVINPVMYLLAAIVTGILMKATWVLTIALVGLVGFYGILSERWRQRIRLPFRYLRYAFGERRKLVDACRSDYRELKQSIKKWLKA